jgi:S-adenosylmethionine uptake transporter
MTSAEHHAYRKNIFVAVLMVCIGYAFYNIGDAALKITAQRFHFSQIFFFNSFIIGFFMIIYGWIKEKKAAFRTKKPKLMLYRAALAQVISICNIYSLPHVHLTTFYTLIFTSPFWVALLSSYFLGDKLTRKRMALILAGFSVILFIFRPGGGLLDIWSVLVLTAAFIYSCQLVLIRHISSSESKSFMILIGATMSMVIAAPILPFHYVQPTPYEWGLFLMMGITSSIGLLSITYAFQAAPSASVVAPYHYTQIVWGALLGYFIFQEVPTTETIVGAALIILLGIYLIYDETRRSALKKIIPEVVAT